MKPSLIEVSPIQLPDPRVLIKLKGNALRRAAARARTRAASQFRRFGIGRRLFDNASAKVLRTLFKTGRLQDDGQALSVDVEARGLAGVQETGGRTKPHDIFAESARARSFLSTSGAAARSAQGLGRGLKRLAFIGRGGRLIRPFSVRHPGGLMKKHEVIPHELDQALVELDADVDKIMREQL